MATLAGTTIAATYALLLKIDSTGVDGTLRKVEDGMLLIQLYLYQPQR